VPTAEGEVPAFFAGLSRIILYKPRSPLFPSPRAALACNVDILFGHKTFTLFYLSDWKLRSRDEKRAADLRSRLVGRVDRLAPDLFFPQFQVSGPFRSLSLFFHEACSSSSSQTVKDLLSDLLLGAPPMSFLIRIAAFCETFHGGCTRLFFSRFWSPKSACLASSSLP